MPPFVEFREPCVECRELLARADIGPDGNLRAEDGAPLLAEEMREALRLTCAEHGATCPADMIVASIRNGGGGHDPGTGPLPAGLPIQVDIFPRHEASGCWADMTRTFVIGEPTAEWAELIAEQEHLVREALEQARAAVRPGHGVSGHPRLSRPVRSRIVGADLIPHREQK